MCGIAGLYEHNSEYIANPQTLERMAAKLHHRGPDDRGFRTFGRVGLAHTRLSIIDLSNNGHQPMANEDNSVWISFNGEIYDYGLQRNQLEQHGHRFRSNTDTEVIIHLYEEYGLEGLSTLNGMFAFALWDARTERLVLARDRTGQKPLYIYERNGHIAFASEIKALLADPLVSNEIDPKAIPAYLAHGYIPSPDTFYQYVKKLEPGSFKVLEHGRSYLKSYWTYPSVPSHSPSFNEAVVEVRNQVDAAVRRRLIADVPLGAFLSGGVDSSIIVASMARQSHKQVKTFCLGYEGDKQFDERPYAADVAKFLNTEHTELILKPRCVESLPSFIAHLDEPFGDASIIPTALVSQLAKQHTTVVLTGDGGDELFGGYARMTSTAYLEWIPYLMRATGGKIAQYLPAPKNGESKRAQLIRFMNRMNTSLPARLHSWIAIFPPNELASLLRASDNHTYTHPYSNIIESLPRDQDTINYVLRINAKTYLHEDLNVKVDRASMRYALETRSPFLDVQLMDYVFRLPGSYKINYGRRKWILRQAFSGLIPNSVFNRPKMGFGLPLRRWFQGPLRALVEDQLRPNSAKLYKYIHQEPVQALLNRHMSNHRDHGFQIWALLVLESWLQGQRP